MGDLIEGPWNCTHCDGPTIVGVPCGCLGAARSRHPAGKGKRKSQEFSIEFGPLSLHWSMS